MSLDLMSKAVFFIFLVGVFCIPTSGLAEVQKKSTSLKGLMGDQKGEGAPLYVKSDSLRLNAKQKVFIYDGNVEIVRGDVRITCDSMKGTYGDDSKLKTILCQDNVVITRGEVLRASSNRAHYDVSESEIELTEGPELARDGNLLSADKITIFVDEDRSEAEGNVRVKVIKADGSVEGDGGFDELPNESSASKQGSLN